MNHSLKELSESKRKDNLHQKRRLFTKPNPSYLFLSWCKDRYFFWIEKKLCCK